MKISGPKLSGDFGTSLSSVTRNREIDAAAASSGMLQNLKLLASASQTLGLAPLSVTRPLSTIGLVPIPSQVQQPQESNLTRAGTERKRKRRRRTEEMDDTELWACPAGCGKQYKRTSTVSINAHRLVCGPQASSAARRRAASGTESPSRSDSPPPKQSRTSKKNDNDEPALPSRTSARRRLAQPSQTSSRAKPSKLISPLPVRASGDIVMQAPQLVQPRPMVHATMNVADVHQMLAAQQAAALQAQLNAAYAMHHQKEQHNMKPQYQSASPTQLYLQIGGGLQGMQPHYMSMLVPNGITANTAGTANPLLAAGFTSGFLPISTTASQAMATDSDSAPSSPPPASPHKDNGSSPLSKPQESARDFASAKSDSSSMDTDGDSLSEVSSVPQSPVQDTGKESTSTAGSSEENSSRPSVSAMDTSSNSLNSAQLAQISTVKPSSPLASSSSAVSADNLSISTETKVPSSQQQPSSGVTQAPLSPLTALRLGLAANASAVQQQQQQLETSSQAQQTLQQQQQMIQQQLQMQNMLMQQMLAVQLNQQVAAINYAKLNPYAQFTTTPAATLSPMSAAGLKKNMFQGHGKERSLYETVPTVAGGLPLMVPQVQVPVVPMSLSMPVAIPRLMVPTPMNSVPTINKSHPGMIMTESATTTTTATAATSKQIPSPKGASAMVTTTAASRKSTTGSNSNSSNPLPAVVLDSPNSSPSNNSIEHGTSALNSIASIAVSTAAASSMDTTGDSTSVPVSSPRSSAKNTSSNAQQSAVEGKSSSSNNSSAQQEEEQEERSPKRRKLDHAGSHTSWVPLAAREQQASQVSSSQQRHLESNASLLLGLLQAA